MLSKQMEGVDAVAVVSLKDGSPTSENAEPSHFTTLNLAFVVWLSVAVKRI